MPSKKRFLSPLIGRFNYWLCFPPEGIASNVPLKQHIKSQFILELTASRTIWSKQIRPVLHVEFPDKSERKFLALEGFVFDDKEWDQDPDAWQVYRQLSSIQKARIVRTSKQKWHRKRQCTWDELIEEIATDQDRFEGFLDAPDTKHLCGTDRRVYDAYHKQANKLLRRWKSPLPLSLKARREAKKETSHWFRSKMRGNMPPNPKKTRCHINSRTPLIHKTRSRHSFLTIRSAAL